MRIPSILAGAAIAALVIVPAVADSNWINGPWRTFDTRTLKLENVVATVRVDVKDSGPMAVQVSGLRERVDGVQVRAGNGTLSVECANVGTVWDWRHWFDFSQHASKPSQLVIHIAVPRGSAVEVEAMAGNVVIGDTQGPLKFEVDGYTDSMVGNVSEAQLEMAGAGRLIVGNVAGPVSAETAGSGNIRIGDAARLKAEVAGSGSVAAGRVGGPVSAEIGGSGAVSVAAINGPLSVEIGGSGAFSAGELHGPLSVDIGGSGNVSIERGEADPLRVDIMGSGDVSFGGLVVNPRISTMGSGSVKAAACRGSTCNDRNLKIGS